MKPKAVRRQIVKKAQEMHKASQEALTHNMQHYFKGKAHAYEQAVHMLKGE